MTTEQLARAFRAADPTTAHDELPTPAATVRAAMARLDRPAVPVRPRRRRVWASVSGVAAAAAVVAVAVPMLDSRTAPTAQAAIRLAAFDGLMTPYVLTSVPPGLGAAQYFGQQGSTTAAYVPATSSVDGVYVSHASTRPTASDTGDVPSLDAVRQEPDGSWLQVSGYGMFAAETTVTRLLANAQPAPAASPLKVALAPSGWRLAAFKDLQPGEGVVSLTPTGTLDGPDEIDVIRYRTTAADFPAGYQDRGPTSGLTSAGRSGILVQGSESWTLQLRLADGGSLMLLLPIRMDRDQVQRFADGVTVPAA